MKRARALFVLAPLSVAACAGVLGFDDIVSSGDAGPDGATADSAVATADAFVAPTALCDPHKPFTSVVQLIGDNKSAQSRPTLTPDELTIYYARTPIGGQGTILASTRASLAASFPEGSSIPSIGAFVTATNAFGASEPSISYDGHRLYFALDANLDAGGNRGVPSLSVAVRDDVHADFTNVFSMSIGPGLNPAGTDQPNVTAKGDRVFYTRPLRSYVGTLFEGIATSDETEIITSGGLAPTISADDRTFYYSTIGGDKDAEAFTIRVADIVGSTPGTAEELVIPEAGTLNDFHTGSSFAGWLSPDKCRLYFSHGNAAVSSIYVASH